MSVTIRPGDLVIQDPGDIKIYEFDWAAENLPPDVSIATSAVTVVRRPASVVAPTLDQASSGLGISDDGRHVKFSLTGLVLGARYTVTDAITDDQTPGQRKERSFVVRCQDR